MDTFKFKRVVAYIVDILIISILLTLLCKINFLNPYMDEYNTTYTEYSAYYNNLIGNTTDNTTDNSTENVTTNETSNEIENVTSNETNTTVDNTNKTLTTEDILTDEYIDLTYKLHYYSIFETILELVVIVLYFTLFPLFFNGQTIGKKVMGLQITSINKDKVKWYEYLIRALFMPLFSSIILYTPLAILLDIPVLFIFKGITYIYVNLGITILFCIFAYADALIGISNKQNLSLHDRLSHTKVEFYEKKD